MQAASDFIKKTMIPDSLVIVEPTNFQINQESINDNQYMANLKTNSPEALHNQVLKEHKNYQNALLENKVNFQVHKQIHNEAYDSIFTCDWLGTIRNEDFPEESYSFSHLNGRQGASRKITN